MTIEGRADGKVGEAVPNTLPLVPLRESVVFPRLVVPLGVGREKSVAALNAAMAPTQEQHYIVLAAQRDGDVDDVDESGIYRVATVANIVRLLRLPDGSAQIIVQGLSRVRLRRFVQTSPFFIVEVEALPDDIPSGIELEALVRNVRSLFEQYVSNGGSVLPEHAVQVRSTEDPAYLADLIAASPELSLEQKQQLLETRSVVERLKILSVFLTKQNEILDLKQKIQSEVQSTLDKTQREYILREQLKAIQKELGEDEGGSETRELREKIEQSGMPDAVKEKALKELERLAKIPQASPEQGVIRTYLDWLITVPGKESGVEGWDIKEAKLMLDEIDKVGADFRGDPSSALLEVLDPEQNNSFSDHYLEVPYDLSKVIFITTANIVDTILPPLRDRMEIIPLPGYTEDEKLKIAQGFLVPRQTREHGLDKEKIVFTEDGLRRIIREYTREAGVRNVEREIATICRKVARRYAEGETGLVTIDAEALSTYLGPARFDYGMVEEKEDQVGAATGVSVSEYGGDVLTVEATVIDGKVEGDKDFMITGQIGKVMEESARAALSYVRARESQLGIPESYFDDHAVHIHVPAGAIPKDGPSAGVTMVTALVSALTGRRVRRDVAMTGEITLRGKVLPIGGVKEKLLAAHRAGIKTFILPEKNKKDLVDVPKEVQDEVAIKLVNDASEVLQIALQQPIAPSRADEPVPASVAA